MLAWVRNLTYKISYAAHALLMKKRSRLITPPRVDRDLLDIWQFGAERWSPDTADQHLHKLKEAAEWLCEWPLSGKPRNELRRGLLSVVVKPHIIFYRIVSDDIQLIRVLHHGQDIE